MIRLVLADLRHHPGPWVWTLIVLAVASACINGTLIALYTGLSAAADAESLEGVNVLGANVVAYTLLAAMAIVGATVGLTLATRAREHALWVVLGVPRLTVRVVLLGQLVTVGVLGWAAGLVGTWPVARVTLDQWGTAGIRLVNTSPQFAAWPFAVGLGVVVLGALLGGWGAAGRTSRTPEMAALREAATPRARVGWLKVALAGHMLFGYGALIIIIATGRLGSGDEAGAAGLAATIMLLTALLLLGGWVLRALLWAWTALVPSGSDAWFLAREACRARAGRSITTVLPFALALSVFGSLMGAGNAIGGEVTIDETLVMFGWVLLVSWVGGAAVIALAGRERARDTALMSVAGASRGTIARAVACEGIIYAVTAILFGVAMTVVAAVTTALAARSSVIDAVAGAPWLLMASVGALTLATTCAAAAPSAIRAQSTPVTETLRAG